MMSLGMPWVSIVPACLQNLVRNPLLRGLGSLRDEVIGHLTIYNPIDRKEDTNHAQTLSASNLTRTEVRGKDEINLQNPTGHQSPFKLIHKVVRPRQSLCDTELFTIH